MLPLRKIWPRLIIINLPLFVIATSCIGSAPKLQAIGTAHKNQCLKLSNYWDARYAEATLYQPLFYEILLPKNPIHCYRSELHGNYILYDKKQLICILTEMVWISAQNDKPDRCDMVFKYNGFTFWPYVFQHLDYFFDYTRDVTHECDYDSGRETCIDWYWEDDNGFDIEDLYNEYVRINEFSMGYEEGYLSPIPGRLHRYFNREGVRVVLYNILPENMEFFYSTTHNSLYVPTSEIFFKISSQFTEQAPIVEYNSD